MTCFHAETTPSQNGTSGLSGDSAQEIALEEEKLKEDSARDVERQLKQQHLAESEEKVAQSIEGAADKILSPKGISVEAKFAPAIGLAEHTIEGAINNGAADIENLRQELQILRERLASRREPADQQKVEIQRLEKKIQDKTKASATEM